MCINKKKLSSLHEFIVIFFMVDYSFRQITLGGGGDRLVRVGQGATAVCMKTHSDTSYTSPIASASERGIVL